MQTLDVFLFTSLEPFVYKINVWDSLHPNTLRLAVFVMMHTVTEAPLPFAEEN